MALAALLTVSCGMSWRNPSGTNPTCDIGAPEGAMILAAREAEKPGEARGQRCAARRRGRSGRASAPADAARVHASAMAQSSGTSHPRRRRRRLAVRAGGMLEFGGELGSDDGLLAVRAG